MDLSKYKKAPKDLSLSRLILFENDNYLVINKPPFVSSLDERTSDRSLSILKLLKSVYSDAQLGHRLDKETSGALVVAKKPEAYRHLAIQFEHRVVEKEYHAVVNGIHELDSISVYLPISQVKDGTAVRIDKIGGKLAETIFFTKKTYRDYSLLRCMPITGRMHQIRVHLKCLKAPIVCDPTYGGEYIYLSKLKRKFNIKLDTEELPLIKRVALHAFQIAFSDLDGSIIQVKAPYPKDFEVLVNQLDKYG